MRIVTFTAIAVALITPSGSSNLGHGRGQVDGGSIIDTFASQGAEVYGRSQVGAAGSLDVLISSGADVYGIDQVDAAESVALFYPSNLASGRGQVNAAGSVELFDASDIKYGRGQVNAAESVELFNSSNLASGRGQVNAAGSVELFDASDIKYGRGQVNAAGSVELSTSDSAEIYGRGQVDAADSTVIVISTSDSAQVYGRCQVDAAGSAVAVASFTYVSNGDTNDILNFIGKNYDNAGTWSNPHTAGRVTVSYSSTGSGSFAALVDRATNSLLYTNAVASSWFAIDFGAGKSVTPNYYSVRHDGENNYFLRNWKLQGSNDAVATASAVTSWTDLDARSSDTTIAAANAWGSWAVTGSSGYRWLRILQTGVNSNGSDYLVFGEFQVYGTFT